MKRYLVVMKKCSVMFHDILMKLIIQGWREDSNDAELPVGVIEFYAGGTAQNAASSGVLRKPGERSIFLNGLRP